MMRFLFYSIVWNEATRLLYAKNKCRVMMYGMILRKRRFRVVLVVVKSSGWHHSFKQLQIDFIGSHRLIGCSRQQTSSWQLPTSRGLGSSLSTEHLSSTLFSAWYQKPTSSECSSTWLLPLQLHHAEHNHRDPSSGPPKEETDHHG